MALMIMMMISNNGLEVDQLCKRKPFASGGLGESPVASFGETRESSWSLFAAPDQGESESGLRSQRLAGRLALAVSSRTASLSQPGRRASADSAKVGRQVGRRRNSLGGHEL